MRCSLLIHDGIEMDKTIVTSLKLASLMQKNRRLKVWNESTISTVLHRANSATTGVGHACAKKANTLLTLILHRFLRSCHSLVHAPSSIEYITRWMCFDVHGDVDVFLLNFGVLLCALYLQRQQTCRRVLFLDEWVDFGNRCMICRPRCSAPCQRAPKFSTTLLQKRDFSTPRIRRRVSRVCRTGRCSTSHTTRKL